MTTTRPTLAVRITKSLLGYGVIAGPIYVVVVAVQAFSRAGFDPSRHVASQLANGDLGWIQIATFLVTGAMTVAAAVGVGRALGPGRLATSAAGLIGGYGTALMVAALFRADPSDGFPPGTAAGAGELSWHGTVHFAAAGLGFVCLVAACLVLAARFAHDGVRRWSRFSRITAIVLAVSFAVVASGFGGRAGIVFFTVAVVLAWGWLTAVSVKLYRTEGSGYGES
jgi:hypothetical protein